MFISLSLIVALGDLGVYIKTRRSRCTPVEDSVLKASKFRMVVDAVMSSGLLACWIVDLLLVDTWRQWGSVEVRVLAVFGGFLAWLVLSPLCHHSSLKYMAGYYIRQPSSCSCTSGPSWAGSNTVASIVGGGPRVLFVLGGLLGLSRREGMVRLMMRRRAMIALKMPRMRCC